MSNVLFKRCVWGPAVLFMAVTLLSSCSKKDDPSNTDPPPSEGLKAKFTIAVAGLAKEGHSVEFIFSGQDKSNPANKTIWKVDGQTRANEPSISFIAAHFSGDKKTYVVETLNEKMSPITVDIKGSNKVRNSTLKIRYKVEMNGIERKDETVVLTAGTEYKTQLNYQ